MTMVSARYLKLPLRFDAARLQAELDALLAPQWIDHFNTRDYDGGWRCLALRSVDGQPRHIVSLSEANFLDTPALARCPYFRTVLDTFECDKAAVRLMALEPGARIKPHRDAATAFEDGLARLHVPLQTDPSVMFRIDGEDIHFSRGDTWYLNAGRSHSVHNGSAHSRIHLVLDCRVNPWLRQLFAQAASAPPGPAAPAGTATGTDMGAGAGADTNADADALHGWYPVAVNADPPGLWWRHLGARPFSEPFFSDTLRQQPPNERLRRFTGWQALDDLPDALTPTAFIFHVSRCGSTLLTQMLATLPACVALSEPPVLDEFLRLQRAGAFATNDGSGSGSGDGDGDVDDDAVIRTANLARDVARLRALVRALGQRRDPRQRHLVIKLDSWHLRDLALFRAAFAHTPMLFLYREPLQVLASHQRQRGPQMLPGLIDAAWLGVTFRQHGHEENDTDTDASDDTGDSAKNTMADVNHDLLGPADLDRYCLHVLGTLMDTALAALRDDAQALTLLNYTQVPQLADGPLLDALGIGCDRVERERMRQRTGFHAKHGAPFDGDPAVADRRGVAPGPALLARLAGAYAALEKLRLIPP